ncbi:ankyrin repeat domain-containing protein [Thalassotalea sp. G20_0]|uniref:ankyrin repeat domain-containing protein n=1 Tax=Thalassotalea sp. G20_0 TaxID=2821093 RepID=UPI001ADA4CAF|nr:ankyrin repeat domain-containing protein [Thalassotalea sp. G20_0]
MSDSDETEQKPGFLARILRNIKPCRTGQTVNERNIDVQRPTVSMLSTITEQSPEDRERQELAEELTQLRTLSNAISRSEALPLNPEDCYGYMRLAARHGFIDIIQYLVEHLDAKVYKDSYHAPIWEAVNSGHLEIVDYLTDHGLDEDNTFYKNKVYYGCDGLIATAVTSNKMDTYLAMEMIKLLIAKGELVDGYGCIAPVRLANENNKLELVNLLLYQGADPEGLENDDRDRAVINFGEWGDRHYCRSIKNLPPPYEESMNETILQ